MKNKNRIYKDEIGTTYAFVKTYYLDRAICMTSNSPGFDLIKYTIVDDDEDIISATRIKHYDTLDEALSNNGYTPHNLKVSIDYRCNECGVFCSKYIQITSAEVLRKVLEEPFLFLNDIECECCDSQNVHIIEICACDEKTAIPLEDDTFGI